MAKDDGQVLPTEQMHERKEIHSDDNNSSVKVKVLISDVITKIGREGVVDATQSHFKCLHNTNVPDKQGCQACCVPQDGWSENHRQSSSGCLTIVCE